MPLIQWRQIASSLGDPVDLIGVLKVTGSLEVLGAINLDGESLAEKFTTINNTISTLSVGSGSVEWNTVLNKPAGIISSSAQISALGFGSGSSDTVDTSSLDSRLDSLEAATSSYTTGAHADISSLNTFTGSANTSIVALNAATSSYITSLPSVKAFFAILPLPNTWFFNPKHPDSDPKVIRKSNLKLPIRPTKVG